MKQARAKRHILGMRLAETEMITATTATVSQAFMSMSLKAVG
jgi:hypothetical protein